MDKFSNEKVIKCIGRKEYPVKSLVTRKFWLAGHMLRGLRPAKFNPGRLYLRKKGYGVSKKDMG